jgi:DNA-binding LacI/PurR family transcriptional regulator
MRETPTTVRVLVTADDITRPFIRPLVDGLTSQLQALEVEFSFQELSVSNAAQPLTCAGADVLIWVCSAIPSDIPYTAAPVVLVAHDLAFVWPVATGYDVVTADGEEGGAIAGDYLRKAGCRNAAIIAARERPDSERCCPLARHRIRGFEKGWGEEIPASQVLLAKEYRVELGTEMAAKVLDLKPRPDAVFGTSDDLADGFCHGLIAHGVQPGRDIKVVGFDGQPQRYRGERVLTTVEVPFPAMAKMAAVMALERAAEPQGVARRLAVACALRKGDTA